MLTAEEIAENGEKRYQEYFLNKLKIKSYLNVNSIEITNNCQLSCGFCPPHGLREEKNIELSLLKKIIQDNLVSFREAICWITMHGEPTLHPKLYEILKLLTDQCINVGLATNCNSLTKSKIQEICDSGISSILLCIDAHTEDTYLKLRQGGNLKRAKENIKNFLSYKTQNNLQKPYTTIQIIDTKDNRHEISDIAKEWSIDGVDSILKKVYLGRANQVKYNNDYVYKAYTSLEQPVCEWLWTSVNILSDGSVVPCCQDMLGKIVLGNLKYSTLEEIKNNQAFVGFRKKHVKNNLEGLICHNCQDARGGNTVRDMNKIDKIKYSFFKKNIERKSIPNSAGEILYEKK